MCAMPLTTGSTSMTSGTAERRSAGLMPMMAALSLLALCATSGEATAGDAAVDALLLQLARPAPDEISFVEVRFSPLLDAPLVIAGKLQHLGQGRLSRTVSEPYLETTVIEGEQVRVSREGEKERSFSLRRAPELRGLLSSFSAILSGDVAGLREFFEVALERQAGDPNRWTLRLVPRDRGLARRLGAISILGNEATVSCMRSGADDARVGYTLLGRGLDDLPQPLTAAGLEQACTGAP